MSVKLLTEHHLEFLSLKRGCTGLFESTIVKMPHCWKSHRGSNVNCWQRDMTKSIKCELKAEVSDTEYASRVSQDNFDARFDTRRYHCGRKMLSSINC